MKIKVLSIYIILHIGILQSCSEGFVYDLEKGDIRIKDFEKTYGLY